MPSIPSRVDSSGKPSQVRVATLPRYHTNDKQTLGAGYVRPLDLAQTPETFNRSTITLQSAVAGTAYVWVY